MTDLLQQIADLDGSQIRSVVESRRRVRFQHVSEAAASARAAISRTKSEDPTSRAYERGVFAFRQAGLRDTLDLITFTRACEELVAAQSAIEYLRPEQFSALTESWKTVFPDMDRSAVGTLGMPPRQAPPSPTERRVRLDDEKRAARQKESQAKAAAGEKQRVRGIAAHGVRIRQSRLKKGQWFISEKESKRKVAPGYFDTEEAAKEYAKKLGWFFEEKKK